MAVDASIEVSSDGGLAAPVVVVFKQENGKERRDNSFWVNKNFLKPILVIIGKEIQAI